MKIKVAVCLVFIFCVTCNAQTTVQEWQAKAVAKYPALGMSGSELNKRFLNAYTERHNSSPAFFTNPQWPMILADELAAQVAPSASPAAQPSPASTPAVSMATPPAQATKTPPPGNTEYEATSIPPAAGLDAAMFRWWAPENTQVRGVLVLIPGRGGDARGSTADAAWRALATQINFGILGCMLKNPPDNTGTYQFDPNGMISALIDKALNAELLQNGQKIKNPPLVFWGHSAGGNVSESYLVHHSSRVVAAVLVRATDGPGAASPGKDDVPVLIFVGKKDKPDWVAASLSNYEKGHTLHAAWTLAFNPREGHEIGKSQGLAIAHITAAVSLRLPPPASSGVEGEKPRQVSKQSGWLGDPESLEIADAMQFKSSKKSAIWFLNESVAKVWQDYMRGP